MSDINTLAERKMRLERGIAKARQEIAEKEAELAQVNQAIAADDVQFAERRQQREQHWQDTDPAREAE